MRGGWVPEGKLGAKWESMVGKGSLGTQQETRSEREG